MDKCFGCRDSRVSIDFSADSEAVNLAIGYAEETDTAAMLDALLTIFFSFAIAISASFHIQPKACHQPNYQ